MRDGISARRRGERGFALVLAILSLMLLTFLGLTLATTTSTELQIATNYRWSQQALYNAEAGLEAARVILANGADTANGWHALLPPLRTGTWADGAAPKTPSTSDREYYRSDCDGRGGVGYGRVLTVASVRYGDQSAFGGATLNGAFTLWVRRPLVVTNAGEYADSPRDDTLVIVAEGVAPYTGLATAFTATRQARRILETQLTLGIEMEKNACESMAGQEGMGSTGSNYNPCAPLMAGADGTVKGLSGVFGLGTKSDRGVE